MLVLIAPDKFKGSLSAMEVCLAIEKGLQKFDKRIKTELFPLADGGDGSLDVISNCIGNRFHEVEVNDPLGSKILAKYLLVDKKAYIELASASGIVLLDPKDQNPMFTSTFGTGEVILEAINNGADEIFLFVGGSSTTDAGIGIAKALGFDFYDKAGNDLFPIGKNLINIDRISNSNLDFDKNSVKFTVLCDVYNPLYGKNGAAFVFSPQKGANAFEVKLLNQGLKHFSILIKEQFIIDISKIKGGGAAGGVAAGLYGLLGADIKSGIETIMEITGFEDKLKKADYIVSGEGKLDSQSLQGKVVSKVHELASKHNKPLVLFVGQNTLSKPKPETFNSISIESILSIAKNAKDAMQNASEYLEQMAFEIGKRLK